MKAIAITQKSANKCSQAKILQEYHLQELLQTLFESEPLET